MHNNDPRIVKKTVPVEQLSFEEAAELAISAQRSCTRHLSGRRKLIKCR
jgi:hypothetical protein